MKKRLAKAQTCTWSSKAYGRAPCLSAMIISKASPNGMACHAALLFAFKYKSDAQWKTLQALVSSCHAALSGRMFVLRDWHGKSKSIERD
jgi:hypothetical protein